MFGRRRRLIVVLVFFRRFGGRRWVFRLRRTPAVTAIDQIIKETGEGRLYSKWALLDPHWGGDGGLVWHLQRRSSPAHLSRAPSSEVRLGAQNRAHSAQVRTVAMTPSGASSRRVLRRNFSGVPAQRSMSRCGDFPPSPSISQI